MSIAEIPLIGGLLTTLLPFLVVLGVVVTIHELGHYWVARWCGIHSEIFSFGFMADTFGEIYGWTDSRGTRWRIAPIPLGGYVKFKGDVDAASAQGDAEAVAALTPEERRATLQGAPLWARSATVAAGPIANFVLSVIIFALVSMVQGKPSEEPVIASVTANGQAAGGGLQAGDRILSVDGAPVETFSGFLSVMSQDEATPKSVVIQRDDAQVTLSFSFARLARVGAVTPNSAAERACLAPGDVILAVGDRPIGNFVDLQQAVSGADAETLAFRVQRGGDVVEVEVTPAIEEYQHPETGRFEQRRMIGVVSDFNIGMTPELRSVGPIEAVGDGFRGVVAVVSNTFNYLGAWISGATDGRSLGGPIGIAQASGQSAGLGFVTFLTFIAIVSTAIGLMNLFPIPVLDGGHLVFYGIEAATGRPVGERWMELSINLGLSLILLLMLFATYNDVARWASGATASC